MAGFRFDESDGDGGGGMIECGDGNQERTGKINFFDVSSAFERVMRTKWLHSIDFPEKEVVVDAVKKNDIYLLTELDEGAILTPWISIQWF